MTNIRSHQRAFVLYSLPRAAAAPRSGSHSVAEVEALERELMKLYSNDPAHNVDKIMEKILHEHVSVPIDMATGRADFQSKK